MGIRSDTLLGAERGLKGTPYSHLVIHLGVYRTSQTGHKTGREMYCSDTTRLVWLLVRMRSWMQVMYW